MRRSTFFGLTALVGLGICTSWITSAALGPMSPRRVARAAQIVELGQVNAPRILEHARVVENDPSALPAEPNRVHLPSQLASFHLHHMKVATRGNTVRVSASASLYDRRPDVAFAWVLRAYDSQKNIAFERYYEDQIFEIDKGEDFDPTFDDAFELGPGSFRVTLSLYELSPDFGLEMVKADRKAARSREILRGVEQVRLF